MSTQIQKLTRLKVGSWRSALPLAAVAATWLISASSAGAVDIQSITLGSVNDTPDVTNNINNITYRGQSQSIIKFQDTTGMRWQLKSGNAPTTYLRRSNAATADSFGAVNDRQVVWSRKDTSVSNQAGTITNPYVVLPSQPTTTQSALDQNNIFYGTDNLFANSNHSPGNLSDVERLDVIFAAPVTVTSTLGVTIFERGLLNQHDGFKIAGITDYNAANDKAYTYGGIASFGANSWGNKSLTGGNDYIVLNNTGTLGSFKASDPTGVTGQDIGGVVIPFTTSTTSTTNKGLGLTAGTTVYGYSLFAPDVTATNTAQLGDYQSNTYFPNATGASSSAGGIDLVAADLGVVEQVPFEFSPSLGLLLLGAVWGVPSQWQRYRLKTIKDS